jgi:predicted permease
MPSAFLLVLGSLMAGVLAARFARLPDRTALDLNRVVIWICLPALILRLVPGLSFDPSLFVLVLTPWLLLGASVGVVVLLSEKLRFRREVRGALLLCVPLGNTSFLGFPMVGALEGPSAIRYAVLYDQLGSFLILSSYGLLVVAHFSGEEKPTVKTALLRVARFPPFVALVVALLPLPRPEPLDDVLLWVGRALVPIAMFAVGLKLRLGRPSDGVPLAVGLGLKMAVAPLLAFALGRLLGAHGAPARVAVLEAGMPPMITAGALAVLANLAPPLASALVGYGVLFSLVTLPAIAWLL